MKTHKSDNLVVIMVAVLTFVIMLAEHQLQNFRFVALSLGALILLRVILMGLRRIPNNDDMRFDHDLQLDLVEHRLLNPREMQELPSPVLASSYKEVEYENEPEYQLEFPVSLSSRRYKETMAKYN